jgi:hypothetical protein
MVARADKKRLILQFRSLFFSSSFHSSALAQVTD